MFGRKGQSALEYLMTYGWALVVIVIVIAALFAFGIFAPPSTGPCTGLERLLYKDRSVATADFNMVIANGTGGTATGVLLAVTDEAGGTWTPRGTNPATIAGGASATLGATRSTAMTSGSHTINASISYTSPAGLTKTERATCPVTVA